jgi:hypothetical protein
MGHRFLLACGGLVATTLALVGCDCKCWRKMSCCGVCGSHSGTPVHHTPATAPAVHAAAPMTQPVAVPSTPQAPAGVPVGSQQPWVNPAPRTASAQPAPVAAPTQPAPVAQPAAMQPTAWRNPPQTMSARPTTDTTDMNVRPTTPAVPVSPVTPVGASVEPMAPTTRITTPAVPTVSEEYLRGQTSAYAPVPVQPAVAQPVHTPTPLAVPHTHEASAPMPVAPAHTDVHYQPVTPRPPAVPAPAVEPVPYTAPQTTRSLDVEPANSGPEMPLPGTQQNQ